MKLYYHPRSSNARRVQLVTRHLGLQVDEVLVDLGKGEHKQPAYLAINPNGKVPTLVDGDLKLWESYAIMVYVSEKSGKRELYPEDLGARTEINRWLFWAASEWAPAVRTLNFENMLKPMLGIGTPDAARVEEGNAELKRLGAILDAQLAQCEHVAGPRLSLADYALAASLSTAVPAKLPVSGFTNIQKWFARIEQSSAWRDTAQ